MALNCKNCENFNNFEQFSGQKFKLKPRYALSLGLAARAEKNAKSRKWHLLIMPLYYIIIENFFLFLKQLQILEIMFWEICNDFLYQK